MSLGKRSVVPAATCGGDYPHEHRAAIRSDYRDDACAANSCRRNTTPYGASTESHERGEVLVAAVFEAFATTYQLKTASLVKLATWGSGVLPPGEIGDALAEELTKHDSNRVSVSRGVHSRD
jgi:hypothetical protein